MASVAGERLVGRVSDDPADEVAGARARSSKPLRARLGRQPVGLLYILPALALFGLVVLASLVHSFWMSLFNWDGVSPPQWVGLKNYVSELSDPTVRQAFIHSLVLIVFYSAVPICLGLVLAAVIARQRIRFMRTWRALLFLPQVISVVVVGVAWQWVLQEDGPLNEILRAIGLGSLTRVWLGDFTWALPSEGAIGTWWISGLCMVLFLAGAQSIDPALYDAANIDGAGPVREFFAITIPGLRKVLAVASILTFALSMNNFALIWVTTEGGPGNRTQVLSTAIYTRAFVLDEFGAASALAILVGLFALIVSYGISRISDQT